MASHQEQSDLDRIRAELEHVKLENASLKLESESLVLKGNWNLLQIHRHRRPHPKHSGATRWVATAVGIATPKLV
ncbi:hypothetical protein DPMN_007603 [Dreissena polymorpha]|uniref:Uncharacterized protein n=1 Tax=Dreissena polymorpha TaxID=45954 RepID=A0A9D4MWI0_DREPO|nr:hypothetical protein DPMN_007603 [Dreissena polymorpha]